MTKSEIKVPAMGESITEAVIGTIIKPSGSQVKVDDELLELETDKVNQILYAPAGGLFSLKVASGDVVRIGQVIGTIDSAAKGQEVKAAEPKAAATAAPAIKEEKKAPPAEPKPKPIPKVSVADKETSRLTKELFVAELQGVEEVKPAAPKPKIQEASSKQTVAIANKGSRSESRRKMSQLRKVIAKRLVEAQQSAAMLTTFNEVDLTHVIALREHYKEAFIKKYGVKLGFMSFFVKGVVSALEAFPDINSRIEGDEIVKPNYYDIGIAVGTERGVIVPVVRDCDMLSFAGIEQAIEEFASRAKKGTLAVEDLQGGTFTITNGGVYGSLLSTPILNPPQSGILGMHKIEKRPVVVDDQIVIRPMMYLALSYDHRIVDGKEAVSFLVHLKNILEDPARLALEI